MYTHQVDGPRRDRYRSSNDHGYVCVSLVSYSASVTVHCETLLHLVRVSFVEPS